MVRLSIYINGSYQQLDIDSSTDIIYKYQVRRFADMADTPIQYSYNIQLPTTDLNCALFQEVYHSDFQNGIFNAWIGTKCIINDGFSDVLRGTLILESASSQSINVRVIDEMNDFFQLINSLLLKDLPIPSSGTYSDNTPKYYLDHVVDKTQVSSSFKGSSLLNTSGQDISSNFRYIMSYKGPYNNFDNAKKYTNSKREDFEEGETFSAQGTDIIDVDWRYRPQGYTKDIIYPADDLSEHQRSDRRWSTKDGKDAFEYTGEYRSYYQLPAIRAMFFFDNLKTWVESNSNFTVHFENYNWNYLQNLWLVFPGYNINDTQVQEGVSEILRWPDSSLNGNSDLPIYTPANSMGIPEQWDGQNEGRDVSDVDYPLLIGGHSSITSSYTGRCNIRFAFNYLLDLSWKGADFTIWKGPACWFQFKYRLNGGSWVVVPCLITGSTQSPINNDWLCIADDSRLSADSSNPNPAGLNRQDFYIETIDPRMGAGDDWVVQFRNLRNNETFTDGIIAFQSNIDVVEGDVIECALHWKGSPHWFTNSANAGIFNLPNGKCTIGVKTTLRILDDSRITFSNNRPVRSGDTVCWSLNSFISSTSITCYTYLTELCKLFNWYWWKVETDSSTEIHIGDCSEYYGSHIFDINNFVDVSTPPLHTPFIPDARYQILRYTDTDSYLEKEYESKFGQSYGSFVLDTNYPYSVDSKDLVVSKFNNWVLGTLYDYFYQYRTSILNKDNKVLPVLEDSTGAGIDFEWFICYIAGARSVDKQFIVTDDNPSFDANLTICWNDHQNSGYIQQGNYPAVFKSLVDVDNPISLHFGIPQVNYESSSLQEVNSLYELFWQKYLADYFDENARTTEVLVDNRYILLESDQSRNWMRGFVRFDQTLYIVESIDFSFTSTHSKVILRRIKNILDYTTSPIADVTPPVTTPFQITIPNQTISIFDTVVGVLPTSGWYAIIEIVVTSDQDTLSLRGNLPLVLGSNSLSLQNPVILSGAIQGAIQSKSASLTIYAPNAQINGVSATFTGNSTTTGTKLFDYNWSYCTFIFNNTNIDPVESISLSSHINYIGTPVSTSFNLTIDQNEFNFIGDAASIIPSVVQDYNIDIGPTGYESYVDIQYLGNAITVVTCKAVPTDADFTLVITYSTQAYLQSVSILIHKQWVLSVTLDQHSLILNKSINYQLTWTVLPANAPNKDVIFLSSNPSVASVDRSTGLITTYQKAGTATIAVAATASSSAVDSCSITVLDYGSFISVTTGSVDDTQQSGSLAVTYPGSWSIDTPDSFITGLSPSSGTGSATVSFNIDQNTSELDRVAVFILRDSSTNQMIDMDDLHQQSPTTSNTSEVHLVSVSRVAGSPGDTFGITVGCSGTVYWNASLMANVDSFYSLSGTTSGSTGGSFTVSSSSTRYDVIYGCVVVIRWGYDSSHLVYTITVPINIFRE